MSTAGTPTSANTTYLHFFSSTSRPLYLQNMLNVLALPKDSLHRVRYDTSLVQAELLPPSLPPDGATQSQLTTYEEDIAKYRETLQAYRGTSVLVTLVTREAQCSEDALGFFPLRRGK